jgi:hypothetical protein
VNGRKKVQDVATSHANEWDHVCLGCGGYVADVLWRLRSVLCHDCRDLRRGVDPVLLQEWAEARRQEAEKSAQALRG